VYAGSWHDLQYAAWQVLNFYGKLVLSYSTLCGFKECACNFKQVLFIMLQLQMAVALFLMFLLQEVV